MLKKTTGGRRIANRQPPAGELCPHRQQAGRLAPCTLPPKRSGTTRPCRAHRRGVSHLCSFAIISPVGLRYTAFQPRHPPGRFYPRPACVDLGTRRSQLLRIFRPRTFALACRGGFALFTSPYVFACVCCGNTARWLSPAAQPPVAPRALVSPTPPIPQANSAGRKCLS